MAFWAFWRFWSRVCSWVDLGGDVFGWDFLGSHNIYIFFFFYFDFLFSEGF